MTNNTLEKRLEAESKLEVFVTINQHLLNALGVGHESLTKICDISKKYHLHSKLTGAGGGGCAYTLLKSSMQYPTKSKF